MSVLARFRRRPTASLIITTAGRVETAREKRERELIEWRRRMDESARRASFELADLPVRATLIDAKGFSKDIAVQWPPRPYMYQPMIPKLSTLDVPTSEVLVAPVMETIEFRLVNIEKNGGIPTRLVYREV